jgi:predicted transcriptional regulator
MKDKIKQTILDILAEKRADGDVLLFATSIEVAHRLKLGAWQVEEIAKGIEGIVKGRTLNYDYYYE